MKCRKCGNELQQSGSSLSCANCCVIYSVFIKEQKEKISGYSQIEQAQHDVNIKLIEEKLQLKNENEQLKNKLAEVSKNTANFIKNVIDTFPDVAIWILTNKENIITENIEFGYGGTWIDPTLTLNENIIKEKGSK